MVAVELGVKVKREVDIGENNQLCDEQRKKKSITKKYNKKVSQKGTINNSHKVIQNI